MMARVQAKMRIAVLILMATVSIAASAATLHLSCKGNALKIGAETPEPATVSVTVDDKWVTVENYPSAERLLRGVDDDIWISLVVEQGRQPRFPVDRSIALPATLRSRSE